MPSSATEHCSQGRTQKSKPVHLNRATTTKPFFLSSQLCVECSFMFTTPSLLAQIAHPCGQNSLLWSQGPVQAGAASSLCLPLQGLSRAPGDHMQCLGSTYKDKEKKSFCPTIFKPSTEHTRLTLTLNEMFISILVSFILKNSSEFAPTRIYSG